MRKLTAHISVLIYLFVAQFCVLKSQTRSNTKLLVKSPSLKVEYMKVPRAALQAGRSKWNHNSYVHVDFISSTFYIFDSSGALVTNTQLSIPGSDKVDIYDFDIAPDHTVWVSGSSFASAGRRGLFISSINPDNHQIVIKTTPYAAYSIAVTSDGSVWTVGSEEIANAQDLSTRANVSTNVLRHYDPKGHLLASIIPYSSVRRSQVITGRLVARDNAVGWYSPEIGSSEYIEVSAVDNTVTRWPGVPVDPVVKRMVSGFALTADGKAFVTLDEPSSPSNKNNEVSLFTLDRASKSWTSLDLPHPSGAAIPELVGSENTSILFADRNKARIFKFDFQ